MEEEQPFLGSFLPTLAMKLFFADLCDAFTKVPVLGHFDPAWWLCLKTDASGFAIFDIILQQQNDVCKGADGAAHS